MSDSAEIPLPAKVPEEKTVDSPFYTESGGFDFDDLTPQFKPVKYLKKQFVVKEARGRAVVAYRNSAMRAAKMKDQEIVGIDGLADSEIVLVAACLFEVRPDILINDKPKELTVSETFVRDMPYRVVKPLYDWIKAVSEIDEGEDEASLLKQKAAVEKKLAKLHQGDSDPGKDGPSGGTAGSD